MAATSQDKKSEIDVSVRLRELMREHKLSVSQIASIAGVSKSAMEKYLAGPSSPRATAMVAICEQLDTSADWLLLGKPNDDDNLRQALLAFMYHLVMKERGKSPRPFPSANSEEAKIAAGLTDDAMELIVQYRALRERERKLSRQRNDGLEVHILDTTTSFTQDE